MQHLRYHDSLSNDKMINLIVQVIFIKSSIISHIIILPINYIDQQLIFIYLFIVCWFYI